MESTGVPLEVVVGDREGSRPSVVRRVLQRSDDVAGRVWPGMFAYQLVFELVPS